MMITKCLILDDEPLARKVLERFIEQLPALELVGSYGNPETAYEFLQSHAVDLLFLDIEMPRLTGTNLIRLLNNPPAVIFVTAFPEYAVEGFELEAVDYLLKPFSLERFIQAVERAQRKIHISDYSSTDGTLLIRANKKWYPVAFQNIRYLQAYGDYVKIFLKDEMLLTKDKLSRLYESELPQNKFFRLHRSYIVALSAIAYIEGNQAFIDKIGLPIGVGLKEELLNLLGK